MKLNHKKIDELIFRLKGAAMTVLNELGHLGINFGQQKRDTVYYREVKIDEYIPDLEL